MHNYFGIFCIFLVAYLGIYGILDRICRCVEHVYITKYWKTDDENILNGEVLSNDDARRFTNEC